MKALLHRGPAVLVWAFLLSLLAAAAAWAEPLTLPLDKRPAWLRQDGIVMAGSWEPLMFRIRRDGGSGYTPSPQQLADYQREHSPEMLKQLKDLGVNFIMMHCYKGAGMKAERESMNDAVKFSKLCHDSGLHVGVYNYSGAFLWELLFKEIPQAEQWVVLNEKGKVTYGAAGYRYYWNRNHPDAEAYYKQIVRFAVEKIQADLIHFDNYSVGPGRDAVSVQRFRQYLRQAFTPEQLKQAGVAAGIDAIEPPRADSPILLRCAWADFCCWSLAESYHAMGHYARSLRPDVLVECNPLGVREAIYPPIDHGRLLQGGEAYWDESGLPGYKDGRLRCRIRTYKVARALNNMAFSYITTPLEAAESIAFNLDCLGAICWFEYGKLVQRPGSKTPLSDDMRPYVRFYRQRHDLLREAEVVADVAVLRSFSSQVFADPKHAQLTSRVENALIHDRAPFQIIHEHQVADLGRYPALVLAGCVALTDEQIKQIDAYAASGGRVCIIGPVATHDQWMMPRKQAAFDNLPADRVIRVAENEDWLGGIRRACGGRFTLSLLANEDEKSAASAAKLPGKPAPVPLAGLCAELTEQKDRRLVHLVNYRDNEPVKDFSLRLGVPEGKHVKRVTLASPDREKDLTLEFQEASRWVTFRVPEVKIYAVAVVAIE